MPEIQCPMCSKANEAEAEECHFCGARLIPLVLDGPADPIPDNDLQETPSEGELTSEELEDIKERLREEIAPSEELEPADYEEEREAESPDWLDTLRPPGRRRKPEDGEEEGEPEKKPRGTDWLQRLRQIEFSAGATVDEIDAADEIELARAELPDWLHVVREDSAEAAEIEEMLVADEFELGEALAVDTPDFPPRGEVVEEEVDVAIEPTEEVAEIVAPPEEIDLEPAEESETAAYARALEPTAIDRIEEKARITKAVLPRWLEALRPIDAMRTLEEVEDEEAQPVETAGPLAGLSDVLIAEPVIATPRTPGVVSPIISTTQRENQQARILQRLVETEREFVAPARARLRVIPILRWIIGFFLVAAVAFPSFRSEALFPSPRWVPQDLGTMRSLVEDLPHDRPALVVADYDPGYAAELEAVGSSLLDHLFQRGMPVVTLSTRATGPALAQRLIDNVAAWQTIVPGENYIHLGYLAGGPTAIQLFSSNPRYGGLSGFLLPVEREWSTLWEAPILSGIDSLDDFGAIVVITAGTETARTWAEQAAPQAGETVFIMVLSAGAEPLMRPYYASIDRQVDAIYTGLPSAKANEQLNGRSGDASLLWDAFGTGGWTAIATLAVGGIVGAVSALLRRGVKEETDV